MGTQADDTLPAGDAPPPSGGALSIGTQAAGRYRIVRLLGTGGMGEVYEAEDLIVGGRIALKTLLPELASSASAVERFRREIALARKVTSQHICRLHDVGTHEGRLFITMELLGGSTLADRVKAGGALPLDEVGRIAHQLVAGLGALHAAGIVHRDFKTSNVMLVDDRAVVTDFGLARSVTDRDAALTAEGGMLGTPAYMAPEQVQARPATAASDIYALGVVLFELATGKLPFREDTAMATATARLSHDPPRPSTVRPGIPVHWDAIILRCLARDPAKRFARVEDVLTATPRSRRGLLLTATAIATTGLVAWGLRTPEPPLPPRGIVDPIPVLPALRSVAVIPVEGQGKFEDPWRLALTFDIHETLATTDLPILALDGGQSFELTSGTGGLLVAAPDPTAAAWKIQGVDAVARTKIHARTAATISLEVTVDRRGHALQRFAIERPAAEAGLLAADVARQIAATLGARSPRAAPDGAIDAEHYERYGAGIAEFYLQRKRDTLEKLASERPDILRSSARLAMTYVAEGQHKDTEQEVLALFDRAAPILDRVLAADPDQPVALASRAMIVRHHFDWPKAEALARHAYRIAPQLYRVRIQLGFTLYLQGKFEAGLPILNAAADSNPLSQAAIAAKSWNLYYGRQYAETLRYADQVRSKLEGEHLIMLRSFEALAAVELARFDEAYSIAKQLPSDDPYWQSNAVIVFAIANHREEALALRTEIGERAGVFMGALMDDALGRSDVALAELERSIASREIHAQFLKIERFSPSLRSHPRFQALMKKLNF